MRDERRPPLRLPDERNFSFRMVLIEADLWVEHVVVGGERTKVTAVIDFEYATVGDPAREFTRLRTPADVS